MISTMLSKTRIWIGCAAVSLALASCAPVPVVHERETISFSGNVQDAGIVSFLPGGGLEITREARERFNALVAGYGDRFRPPIGQDFGISEIGEGRYSLTFQGAEKWHSMILMEERERINKPTQ